MAEKKNDGFDFTVRFRCASGQKKRADAALRGTPFTLSDYLRRCLADLAEGRVVVKPSKSRDARK